jgi:hypothetical protein
MEIDENMPIAPINSALSKRHRFSSPNLKKFFLLSSYFAAVPAFIVFLIVFSLYLVYGSNGYISRQFHQPNYQALPANSPDSNIVVGSADARIKALDSFFASYNSPLEGHANTIVSEADKYNIDYRLLPAIAMQESTLCKKIIKNSYNCWGFGIYGKKVTKFDSYDDGIKTVTATLAKKYVHNGYESIEDIAQKYTPNDNGKWKDVVSMIMIKLQASL